MQGKVTKGRSVFFKVMALFMVLALLVSVSVIPQETVCAATPADSNWTLISSASDEFDGTALDSSKWNNGIWYDVSSALAFKDSNVSVSNGNLVLTAKKESYNGKAYTIGSVESKFDVPGAASYVEVRAKCLDRRANVLSAIWMQSSPLSSALNPNPEIDIQETFDFYKLTSALHTWNIQPDSHMVRGSNNWYAGVDVSSDYHIYGLERRDGKLKFYFDGALAWETTPTETSLVQMSRHMVLSLEGHLGAPVDAYLPSSFLVDYVRSYSYNGPVAGPANGTYKLVNRLSGKVLEVPDSSTSDGTQLSQYSYSSGNNQKWVVTNTGSGKYTLKNVNSNKYVDVSGGSLSNGAKIIQWYYNGDSNQQWNIIPTGDGYYKIISCLSGKALCVLNASTADGEKIIQWSYGTDQNDQWQIVAP